MPVGGKRVGAGRKSGAAWKGRQPRSDAVRLLSRKRVQELLKAGTNPLDVLCAIAADEQQDIPVRLQAAGMAAPYLFPRLSAAVVATAPLTAKDDTSHLIERLSARFAKLMPPVIPTIDGEAS